MEIQRKNHSHTFGQKKVRKKKSNPWRIPRMRQRNAKAIDLKFTFYTRFFL